MAAQRRIKLRIRIRLAVLQGSQPHGKIISLKIFPQIWLIKEFGVDLKMSSKFFIFSNPREGKPVEPDLQSSQNAIAPTKPDVQNDLNECAELQEDISNKERRKRNRSAILGILVGDSVHNFVDGVAIGVSWAQSWETGLATSLAIFLHELPHELADFTIYINFGLTNAAALGANTFSAFWSYGGLYTGLALSGEKLD